MRRLILRYFTVLLLGVLVIAAQPAQAAKVYVSAAASLKEAVDEIALSFARNNPGTDLAKNYGGSGSLAQQLENGAPVDVFISASPQWVTYLQEKKLLQAQSVADFAYNELVFAAPPTTKAGSLKDLLHLQRIAIGSPKSVPAGEYALEALKKAGIEGALAKKLVMARDVRECLMYAERGEVDGALVYRTDALLAKKSKILFVVPQNLYGRVIYRMALTANGAKSREAQVFYRYLSGAQAKGILAKYGFTTR